MSDDDGATPGKHLGRIAFAHDWLVARRGGELVLEALVRAASALGDPARLYTLFDHGVAIGEATDAVARTHSALSAMPARTRRWLMPLYPWGVGRLSRRLGADHSADPIGLLISTSSAAIKAMRAPPGVPHLCYCHSPARYVWSRAEDYRAGSGAGPTGLARELGLGLIRGPYRSWDRRTARDGRVTRFLANSAFTASEIERCYGVDAEVLHPPVRTAFFTPDDRIERGAHWVVVSALEPYKRIGDAIRASALAGVELEIIGTGSDEAQLRDLGERLGARIRWRGRVHDDAVRDAYRRAAVLLFPQVEDFGIVAAEALACGTPVAARRAGGAIDIIGEGGPGVGVLYESPDPADEPDAGAALAAAAGLAAARSDAGACRSRAARFSESVFAERATSIIASMLGGA